MNKIFSVLISVIFLTSACTTFTKNDKKDYITATANISEDIANVSAEIKTIDLNNGKIKKYDKKFRKYLKKHFNSDKSKISRLYSNYLTEITQQKPLAKITRPDNNYILVFSTESDIKAFSYDKQDKLFGWAEEEIVKNNSSQLTVAFYDYRITDTNNPEYTDGKVKYILFLEIDKKNMHYIQFIYDENYILKCAQIDNEVYALSAQDNLIIDQEYYRYDFTKKQSDKESFPIIEIAEGTMQLGIMGAVIASALSYLPAWIWMGYVGIGAAPWIILMIAMQ